MENLGFSQLEEGMMIEVWIEDGKHQYIVEKIEVPSPTKLGSDFFHSVTAFRLSKYTDHGTYIQPSSQGSVMYIPGFPGESTIQPVDFKLLGFYKVKYVKDRERVFNDKKLEETKQALMEALKGLGKDGLLELIKEATK